MFQILDNAVVIILFEKDKLIKNLHYHYNISFIKYLVSSVVAAVVTLVSLKRFSNQSDFQQELNFFNSFRIFKSKKLKNKPGKGSQLTFGCS